MPDEPNPTDGDDAVPVPVDKLESQPLSSGRVHAVTQAETSARHKSLKTAAAGALGGGVKKLGNNLEALGGVVEKLGDVTSKVPLVGSSVATLGAGITQVGESLADLPRVASTRHGRVLLRSMAVAFVVVFAWIAAIVGYQLHDNDPTDFRPLAEHILVQLSSGPGEVHAAYEQASPRFQEMVREELFERQMAEQLATIGKFREITAVNETLVTTGPTGKIGRVSLTVAYDRAICRGSVSFHDDDDGWHLLGVGIELPPEMTVMAPGARSAADDVCPKHDVDLGAMDPKACSVHAAAAGVFAELTAGHAGAVWDNATPVFQKQEDRATFEQVQHDHAAAMGSYKRVVAVTEAKYTDPDHLAATFDCIVEFEHATTRAVFGFVRASATAAWQLRMFKVVVPLPH
jgi:hypothetical protein|nr:hypothetical protein [Kofleriaceae bacterium]